MAVHGLPVLPVPKELHVAFVWDDVIDHVGRATTSADAKAVAGKCEEFPALSAPLGVVAAISCVRPAAIMCGLPRDLTGTLDASRHALATSANPGRKHRH